MRAFYGLYAEQHGKSRWGDKSPSYVRRMRRVHAVLPEARFVHLIRDGRDVALSQLEVHHGADEVTEAAGEWVAGIEKARRASRRVGGYLELRYEDLVSDAEPLLRRVCELTDLDFDPAMLDYHRDAEERMAETIREFDRGSGGGTAITRRAAGRPARQRLQAPAARARRTLAPRHDPRADRRLRGRGGPAPRRPRLRAGEAWVTTF